MLMNTMEALGTGQALSAKGEAPGLNLGADAETLALFASLFAMMQTPPTDGADTAETSSDSPVPQMQPGSQENKPLLPAAAMLMAGLAPSAALADADLSGPGHAANVSASADGSSGDAAGLLKLLLAAHDIAAPDQRPATPADDGDAGIAPVVPARTATEMLSGAIEILKSLEAGPVAKGQDIPAVSPDALPQGPMPMVNPALSADFIGPMPVVTPSTTAFTTMSAPVMALLAEPGFIGPMPAVTTPTTSSAPAAVTATIAAPAPDFVGPMPAIRSIVTAAHNSPEALAPVPDAAADDAGHGGDEGFVHRRMDIPAAGKDMTGKTAEQKMAADIQATRMAALRAGAETAQGSSASTSATALAQHMAASLTNSQGAAANAQDMAQTAAANTATNASGGQGGTQSGGGQPGGQSGNQSGAQQMMDGGASRGPADRTLLHRLNTDNAGWSETMVKRLTSDLRSGVQNVRIILEPRQLGRLNVELGLRNGLASIRIAAETQEAARLLSGARGQLGQMLESAGLRLAGFQATGSQAGDAGLDTGQGSQGRGGDGAGDHDARNNAGRNQEFSNKMATALDETADDGMTGEDALREGETAVLSILA